MITYSDFMKTNRKSENLSTYEYWLNDYTYIRGAYDLRTGKGIEQVLELTKEQEVNRKAADIEEARKYHE